MAKPVGPVERKQFDGFLPSGGLASFLEGQNVFPVKALANRHDGLAGVKGVGHQAEGQFGKLLFEPLTQPMEALEFTVLLLGLRVVQVHLLVHDLLSNEQEDPATKAARRSDRPQFKIAPSWTGFLFIRSNRLLAGLGEAGGHVFHIRPIRKERRWKMGLAMDLQGTTTHLALEQSTFFVSVRPFLVLRR